MRMLFWKTRPKHWHVYPVLMRRHSITWTNTRIRRSKQMHLLPHHNRKKQNLNVDSQPNNWPHVLKRKGCDKKSLFWLACSQLLVHCNCFTSQSDCGLRFESVDEKPVLQEHSSQLWLVHLLLSINISTSLSMMWTKWSASWVTNNQTDNSIASKERRDISVGLLFVETVLFLLLFYNLFFITGYTNESVIKKSFERMLKVLSVKCCVSICGLSLQNPGIRNGSLFLNHILILLLFTNTR